jgi:hypothetical protein
MQLEGLGQLKNSLTSSGIEHGAFRVVAATEDKTDDMKGSVYDELEHIFNKFPKYHMKNVSGNSNAKVGREDIFKPTAGNESLHEISNDNGVKVVIFATSISLIVVKYNVSIS